MYIYFLFGGKQLVQSRQCEPCIGLLARNKYMTDAICKTVIFEDMIIFDGSIIVDIHTLLSNFIHAVKTYSNS